jgi:hypothetical protein
MRIYTHVDQEARDNDLASFNKLLGGGQDIRDRGQLWWSTSRFKITVSACQWCWLPPSVGQLEP